MTKPIYRREGTIPCRDQLNHLKTLIDEIVPGLEPELKRQIHEAVADVEEACKAKEPISRGFHRIGYGIDATRKAVACDTAISILRAIKKIQGWGR